MGIVGIIVGIQQVIERNASAAGLITFSEFATHPYASKSGFDRTSTNYYTGAHLCTTADFCPSGQEITDLEVTNDGTLIAGYGDWEGNADSFGVTDGRVGVAPLDLQTKQWGPIFYAGSEAIQDIRTLGMTLYIPTTDPSDKAAAGNATGNISGYITNKSGDWAFQSNKGTGSSQEHTFDVSEYNGDIYTAGARTMDGQEVGDIRRSTDGGATWETVQRGTNFDGFDRFTWIAELNGKLYTRSTRDPATSVRVFDGADWTTKTGVNVPCFMASNTQVFDGYIVCSDQAKLALFDGETSSSIEVIKNAGTVRGTYVRDGYLYVMTQLGIIRTNSLSTPHWEKVAVGNNTYLSMAVHNDQLYIGSTQGKILKGNTSLSEVAKEAVTLPLINPCFTFDEETRTITDYLDDYSCTKDVVIPEEINGVPVESIGTGAFLRSGLTSVQLPEGLLTIGQSAFAGNELTSVSLPVTLNSVGGLAFSSNRITDEGLDIPENFDVNAFQGDVFSSNNITRLPRYFYQDRITKIPGLFGSNKFSGTLVIPDNIEHIEGAFANNSITDVVLPEGIKSLLGSFYLNQSLHSINLPSSLESIGANTFGETALTRIELPEGLKNIDDRAFYGAPLQTLTIPEGVKNIGEYAFYGTDITNLKISSSVNDLRIEYFAFQNASITDLELTGNISLVGSSAFSGNPIKNLLISSGVRNISVSAFNTYSSYDSITVNSQEGFDALRVGAVKKLAIGGSVVDLSKNSSIARKSEDVSIQSGVNNIPSSFFGDTLKRVEINNPDTIIDPSAFDGSVLDYAYFNTKDIPHLTGIFNEMSVTTLRLGPDVQTGDLGAPWSGFEEVYIEGRPSLTGDNIFANLAGSASNPFADCITQIQPPPTTLDQFIPCYNQTMHSIDPSSLTGSFVKVYAAHPELYKSTLYLMPETFYSDLLGTEPGIQFLGGYLVNPTSVTVEYKDKNGKTIAPSVTQVGPGLSDYSYKALFDKNPNPTSADLQGMYYQAGKPMKITPPAVDGYTTPAAWSGTLTASNGTISFVYPEKTASPVKNPAKPGSRTPISGTKARYIPAQGAHVFAQSTLREAQNTDTSKSEVSKSGEKDTESAPIHIPSDADKVLGLDGSKDGIQKEEKKPLPLLPIILGSIAGVGLLWWIILLAKRRKRKES